MKPVMFLLCHATLVTIALAVVCSSFAIADDTENPSVQTAQKPVLKNAQEFVEFFRQSEEWRRRNHGARNGLSWLMDGNRLAPETVKVLGEALETESDEVRDRIIELLDEIKHDILKEHELRDPDIIGLLIGPGFAKTDSARSSAMNLLSEYASPATLSRYGDAILKAFMEEPEPSVLTLIAKAKPKGAFEVVDRFSRLPAWEDDGAMKIARAALGDTEIEDEYIASAKREENAGDAKELVETLEALVRIGTPRSLRFVCQRIRSPLTIKYDTGTSFYEKISIRLDVMNALLYVFPEEFELLHGSSAVRKDGSYARVEQLCKKKTGVSYDGIPSPGFFTGETIRK